MRVKIRLTQIATTLKYRIIFKARVWPLKYLQRGQAGKLKMKLIDKQKAVIRNNVLPNFIRRKWVGKISRLRAPSWYFEKMIGLNLEQREEIKTWISNLSKDEASEIISKIYELDYEWLDNKIEDIFKYCACGGMKLPESDVCKDCI